jgi:hypothetical protein
MRMRNTEIAKMTKMDHISDSVEPVFHSGRWVLPGGEISHGDGKDHYDEIIDTSPSSRSSIRAAGFCRERKFHTEIAKITKRGS